MLTLNPGEPISGQIQGAGLTAEPFHGWVELTGKLERLRVMLAAGGPESHQSPAESEHDER